MQLLIAALETGGSIPSGLVQMVIGAALVAVSFWLRQGHPGFAVAAFVLTAANLALAALFPDPQYGSAWVFMLILPVVMLLLTLNGLRGWLWIRRNHSNTGSD